ncbi:MAG: D-tyrosyl-tRNA(Tyr) deacylase [Bacteroidetes bacterium]|nr:D-tyrosyl-tRNA(Tyr) deacylase [Bacteroidota bacterium]
MRAIIQRVKEASIFIKDSLHASVKEGLLVFVGIEDSDNRDDIEWLAGKIVRLRIFNDHNGIMNLPVTEMQGEIMVVSQFTLHASTRKGNRPSYIKAAKPEIAIPLYEAFIHQLEMEWNRKVKTGVFGADMKISLVNDGPVTIFMDTKNKE